MAGPEVVLVHGAFVRDGAWWWGPVAERLAGRGVVSRAVALPSCGEAPDGGAASPLAADADALRRVLDDLPDGAVVVGHSYGGTVIAEGADHPAARHLLYLSSYLPRAGTAQSDVMADEPDPVAVEPVGDGRLAIAGYDEQRFAQRFLQDVADPAVRTGAWHRVVPQQAGALLTPTSRAAWQDRPSTYVVCTEDRSTSVALQREQASRATRSVDLAAGHHPFLSQPDAVAAEVLRILAAL